MVPPIVRAFLLRHSVCEKPSTIRAYSLVATESKGVDQSRDYIEGEKKQKEENTAPILYLRFAAESTRAIEDVLALSLSSLLFGILPSLGFCSGFTFDLPFKFFAAKADVETLHNISIASGFCDGARHWTGIILPPSDFFTDRRIHFILKMRILFHTPVLEIRKSAIAAGRNGGARRPL